MSWAHDSCLSTHLCTHISWLFLCSVDNCSSIQWLLYWIMLTYRELYVVAMCYYCDRWDLTDQPWPHHLHYQNSQTLHWTVGQCSSKETCQYPIDCLTSKSHICCSPHFSDIDSLIQPFPLSRMMPTAIPKTGSTDTPKSSSAPASKDSCDWWNIELRQAEWS